MSNSPAKPQPRRASGSITVNRRKVDISNIDKPLYPDGFTKGQVIEYYGAVAPELLAHTRGRAVTLKRYPNGTSSPYFFQKNCAIHRPDWVKTVEIVGSTGETNHCLIDGVPELLWAANLAAIEIHVPMALAKKPKVPTTMVFDLDPGPGLTMIDCARLGLRLKDLLEHFHLECFPKTSGNKGLHVYAPLNVLRLTFDQTKEFARAVATILEKETPATVTATMAKKRRIGRVFIDWSQNDEHKTTVAAYSLRATPTPKVSTPVSWKEISASIQADDSSKLSFGPQDVLTRLKNAPDLFGKMMTLRQALPTGLQT